MIAALVLPACSSQAQEAQASAQPSSYTVKMAQQDVNPLTGMELEEACAGVRPIAVMIDNVQAALPQRGLSEAGIVYESVTESGITRLMAMYYSSPESVPVTGPVRSARDQFVQLLLPMGAMLVHTGSSTTAAQMLALYQWEDKCLNGSVQPDLLTLDTERNTSLDIEHCWFTSGAQIATAVEKYDLQDTAEQTPLAFSFASEPVVPEEGKAADVYVRFSGYSNSRFLYDAASESYWKWQFGAEHIDGNTGEQLSFDNLLVLFAPCGKYPDGVLTKVDFQFGGVGYYISRGGYQSIRWLKGNPEEPLRIVRADTTETPVEINTGRTYIAVVPLEMYQYFAVSETAGDPSRPPQ